MTAGQGQSIYCSRRQEVGVSSIGLISRAVHSIDGLVKNQKRYTFAILGKVRLQ